jgi:hypothetical protein
VAAEAKDSLTLPRSGYRCGHAFHGLTDIDPLDELERHLTGALAVLLREPSLKIDASMLRMLAKHPGVQISEQ